MQTPRTTASRPTAPAQPLFRRVPYADGRIIQFHIDSLPWLAEHLEQFGYVELGPQWPLSNAELRVFQHRRKPFHKVFVELGGWWCKDPRWAPDACRAVLTRWRWVSLLPGELLTNKCQEVARW